MPEPGVGSESPPVPPSSSPGFSLPSPGTSVPGSSPSAKKVMTGDVSVPPNSSVTRTNHECSPASRSVQTVSAVPGVTTSSSVPIS
ncbi:hypothetical protein ACFFX0_26575 [Citricoccus parietis]|uniref:Uncharacterized protein n=1 Tax=Citricoccus parietis TaxID=592307 RepID=A0ABV5G6J2_9MICC